MFATLQEPKFNGDAMTGWNYVTSSKITPRRIDELRVESISPNGSFSTNGSFSASDSSEHFPISSKILI